MGSATDRVEPERQPSDDERRAAEEAGRGRQAQWPSEIPRPGWKDILTRVGRRVSRDNISIIAAGAAFYAFVAIPSALTALVALYGLAFNPDDVQQQISGMAGVLPGDAINLISSLLKTVTSNSNSKLSISAAIAILVALWSARSGTSSMITALNVAYGEEEKRGFIKFQVVALGLTACAIAAAIIALALIAVLPAIIGLLPLGNAGKAIAAIVRWPILIVLVVVALAAMYRFAPSRDQPRWRWVSWGAVLATVLWIVGSALFSIYVGQFASYNKSYGSLGAVVVLLMWLYLTTFAVLLGAEVNAEMEHQTARDSTTGPEKPMGERGAKMADTLGKER